MIVSGKKRISYKGMQELDDSGLSYKQLVKAIQGLVTRRLINRHLNKKLRFAPNSFTLNRTQMHRTKKILGEHWDGSWEYEWEKVWEEMKHVK